MLHRCALLLLLLLFVSNAWWLGLVVMLAVWE
jgi:hypothetical protein